MLKINPEKDIKELEKFGFEKKSGKEKHIDINAKMEKKNIIVKQYGYMMTE